ncbi:MAG: hypothetical protein U9N76_07835 [Candidatus Marinimicrobia bacterium]|nr:hypothetical protein [Candidatus Neomarinimicrobiota bacterium]
MEVKLDKLIEKIKKEGVVSGEKEADTIIKTAKETAKNELATAKKEIEKQREKLKKEIDDYKVNANNSIKQSARDTIISVKDEIKNMFNNTLDKKIIKSFDEDLMKNMILEMATSWAKGKDIEVMTNGVDVDKLQSMITAEVKGNLENSIEIKLDKKISHGFKVGIKGEEMYYDFTDASILESLKLYLNPKLNKLLS